MLVEQIGSEGGPVGEIRDQIGNGGKLRRVVEMHAELNVGTVEDGNDLGVGINDVGIEAEGDDAVDEGADVSRLWMNLVLIQEV